MSKYPVNYSNVNESQKFEPLPEGTYPVQIERIEETRTKGGKPMIKVRYVVTSGQHKGRKLFDQVTLFEANEKGAGITKHFLHIIGEPYEGEFEVDPDNWPGRDLQVTVTVDTKFDSNQIKSRELPEEIPF